MGETRPVHDAITCLQNYGSRTNLAVARAAGLPIGSGNVVATCKRLVRTGGRWLETTGQNIIDLRALCAQQSLRRRKWNSRSVPSFVTSGGPLDQHERHTGGNSRRGIAAGASQWCVE